MKDTAAWFGCAFRFLLVIFHSIHFTIRILKLCRLVFQRRLFVGTRGHNLIEERSTMRQLPLMFLVLHNTNWQKTNHFTKWERIQFYFLIRTVALRLSFSLMVTSFFASFIILNFCSIRNLIRRQIAVLNHYFGSLRKFGQGKSCWRQKSPE